MATYLLRNLASADERGQNMRRLLQIGRTSQFLFWLLCVVFCFLVYRYEYWLGSSWLAGPIYFALIFAGPVALGLPIAWVSKGLDLIRAQAEVKEAAMRLAVQTGWEPKVLVKLIKMVRKKDPSLSMQDIEQVGNDVIREHAEVKGASMRLAARDIEQATLDASEEKKKASR